MRYSFRKDEFPGRINLRVAQQAVDVMADLESVLADVSFLLAVDKSRGEPATTKVAKRIVLPDARFERGRDKSRVPRDAFWRTS